MIKNYQEYQYLNLMRKILDHGTVHENRTGIPTRRLICETMKFDISEEFPLLTTKKVYWKAVCCELIWFLSGSTNIKYLQDNNVHIWDANAKDYYEKKMKLLKELNDSFEKEKINTPEGMLKMSFPWSLIENLVNIKEGDTGPIYGAQWLNFNGVNQISWVINEIKTNPSSRKIIVSAWNPKQLQDMCLTPCHPMFKFTVSGDKLNCTVFQVSGDFFLGVAMNIASYALLTYMVAHVTGLKPGSLNHVIEDCHIYENHISACEEQLKRKPYPFPTIKLNPDIKNIFDFKYEDIELIDYQSHPAIKAEMAV